MNRITVFLVLIMVSTVTLAQSLEITPKDASSNRSIAIQAGAGFSDFYWPSLDNSKFTINLSTQLSAKYQWVKNERWTYSTGLTWQSHMVKYDSGDLSNLRSGFIYQPGSSTAIRYEDTRSFYFLGSSTGMKRTFNSPKRKLSPFVELNMALLVRISIVTNGTLTTTDGKENSKSIYNRGSLDERLFAQPSLCLGFQKNVSDQHQLFFGIEPYTSIHPYSGPSGFSYYLFYGVQAFMGLNFGR